MQDLVSSRGGMTGMRALDAAKQNFEELHDSVAQSNFLDGCMLKYGLRHTLD